MREITAFESVDGTIFTDVADAEKHDLDCIGAELAALFLVAAQATGGNVTRNDQYNMVMRLLNERKNIAASIHKLSAYLKQLNMNEE